MSLLASLMCGNQSRGGLERCLDSVTNHSSLGQPEEEEEEEEEEPTQVRSHTRKPNSTQRVCVNRELPPLNCGISPVALLGSPLWQASLVSATVTPQLPSRKPIC